MSPSTTTAALRVSYGCEMTKQQPQASAFSSPLLLRCGYLSPHPLLRCNRQHHPSKTAFAKGRERFQGSEPRSPTAVVTTTTCADRENLARRSLVKEGKEGENEQRQTWCRVAAKLRVHVVCCCTPGRKQSAVLHWRGKT